MNIDNVFIVTKPLQYLIVMCIIKDLKIINYKILIIDSFYEAPKFYKSISVINENVIFHKNKKKAYNFIASKVVKKLFTDSDVGYKNHLDLKRLKKTNKNISINIYEEGTGTYRNMYNSLVKIILFKMLGVSSFFGGSKYVDSIFVYNVNKYQSIFKRSNNAVEIRNTIQNELSENLQNYNVIFKFDIDKLKICKNRVILYLANKNEKVNNDVINSDKCDVFLKQHPATINKINNISCTILNPSIPAELVLVNFLKKYKEIQVYSFNSSTSMYINSPKISFINLNE